MGGAMPMGMMPQGGMMAMPMGMMPNGMMAVGATSDGMGVPPAPPPPAIPDGMGMVATPNMMAGGCGNAGLGGGMAAPMMMPGAMPGIPPPPSANPVDARSRSRS